MNSLIEPIPSSWTRPAGFRRWRHRVLKNRALTVGVGLLVTIALIALLAPLITAHDPFQQTLTDRLLPPIWEEGSVATHPLGTDHLGRDYLSRLIYGARISLVIGFTATLISGVIGTTLGLAAGYFGGRVDLAITFLITVRLSVPVVIVALGTVALVGSSLPILVLTLGLLVWDRFAVVTRSSVQQVRNQEYIRAAQDIGCSTLYILFVEVLGNVLGQTHRRRHTGSGERHPARSRAELPRSRRAGTAALLGADDCGGT